MIEALAYDGADGLHRHAFHHLTEEQWLALRDPDLTSTDVPALFNLSPYQTRFELWHKKNAARRADFKSNERMHWGNRLEAAIAHTLADDNGWAIRPMKEYIRIPELRLGCSFDYRIQLGTDYDVHAERISIDTPDDELLEIKNVDWLAFKRGWVVERDSIEAPDHIEIQVQHQLLCSGLRRARIGVLVGGNDVRILERERDEAIIDAIRSEAQVFWQSIADNNPPPPIMPDDADAVIRLHQYAKPGSLLDARGAADLAHLVDQLKTVKNEIARLEDDEKAMKAELLERLGDYEKAIVDGFKVNASMVAPNAGKLVTPDMVGTYVGGRAGYRQVRITAAK